mmetsp:Transcript_43980/g.110858  ORF Transcript_43980/g.110858 Transcript_43980/m.110858 type:complete len:265 (+) Transcript_43980:53-847(+)
MARPNVLALAFLVLACVMVASSIDVLETDSGLLFINIPMHNETLRNFIHPSVEVDTFNGSGWVTLMVYHIDSLKGKLLGHWVPLGGAGMLVKTVTYVTHGDKKGYLILSMDFDSSIMGGIESLGCKATQKGVLCRHANEIKLTKEHVTLSSTEGATITGSFSISNQSAPSDLLTWFIKRDFKFLQDGSHVSMTPSLGKSGAKVTCPSVGATVQSAGVGIGSTLLSTRFGWTEEQQVDICANGECFFSHGCVFVDETSETVVIHE